MQCAVVVQVLQARSADRHAGGTSVPLLGAVLSSYAAAYQVAIQITASIMDGDYPIVTAVNGMQSPGNTILTVQH